MGHLLHLALLALWAAAGGWAADKTYCDFTPKHTLCNYDGVGPKCGQDIPVNGVTNQEAVDIVALHNELRSKVATGKEKRGNPGRQPKATNMMLMEWDRELARVAQAHADQCTFQHDCRDCRRVSRFGVGQNLYISFQSNFDKSVQWDRAIQSWYDEVAIFNKSHIQPFKFSKGIGHYTQMMWWNTNKIGCGLTMFKEGNWWKKLYTCNYGPAGNIISSQMYETGRRPCSSCPAGTTCSIQYSGLCQSVESSGAGMRRPLTDNNNQDNAIPNPPTDDSNNGLNVFNGFTDLNDINPRDVDLDALIRFFNSRRRTAATITPTRTRLPVSLNAVLNRRIVRPALITAAPTTTTTTTIPSASTSTPQSRSLPTASTAPVAPTAPTTTVSTAAPTTTTTTTVASPPSSATTSSPQESTTIGSILNANQIQVRGPLASSSLEHEDEGGAAEEEDDDDDDAAFIPISGAEPTTSDLMPFLRRAGLSTSIIRTSSLDNVQNIIEALPPGHRPIVLFRSGSGQLTELNPETLVPLQRSIRSTTTTTTTRVPGTEAPALFLCDLDLFSCDVAPVVGNWTVAESETEGQYMEAALQEGEGAHLVVKQLVDAPEGEDVCVTLSHRRNFTVAQTTNAALPPLQVGVMPLGERMTQWPVLGAPGVWDMSRVTLQGLKGKFMVAITAGPASAPASVGLGALMVAQGGC